MNPTPTHAEAPDDLDRLFSEFFRSQLKHPWPNAPVPPPATGAAKPTEPSELVAARTQSAPRNAPTPSRRDGAARARFTLAASVALLLGTCWYLSNGFSPGARPAEAPNPGGPGMLNSGDAKGTKGGVLDTINQDKTRNDGGKVDVGKFE